MSNRETWLAERNTLIGASETPSILGKGFETPADVWLRKTGQADGQESTERMEIGTVLQPAIIELARRKMGDLGGLIVEEPDFHLRRSAMIPYVGASLDAYVSLDGEQAPLDAKNVDRSQAAEWDNEPPPGYQIQLQQQMFVTGASHGYLFALIGGNRTVWHRVERNEKFIAAMLKKLAWFWKLVETRTPPPYQDPADQARVLATLYPKDTGTAIQLDDLAANIVARRDALTVLAAETDNRLEECKNELKALLGENSYGALPDGRWVSWKQQTTKAHMVAESTYRVLRFHNHAPKNVPSINYEQAPVSALEFDETQMEPDYVDRATEAEAALLSIGAVSRHVSQSGSRYLLLPGGLHVRVSDHGPNQKTKDWMNRHGAASIRVDWESWREQIEKLTGPQTLE